MKNTTLVIIPLLLVLALAGCAGREAVKPTTASAEGKNPPATAQPATAGAALSAEEQQRAALLAQHRVHFAFDSSAIDNEARAIIEAHAQDLIAHPATQVTLEGHCDERGTAEYNLALGERRAQAVARMMKVLGVATGRIKTVSYGKEKPRCTAHNEACWHQNRRVEIIYR